MFLCFGGHSPLWEPVYLINKLSQSLIMLLSSATVTVSLSACLQIFHLINWDWDKLRSETLVCFTGPEHSHFICWASGPNQVVFIKVALMDSPLAYPRRDLSPVQPLEVVINLFSNGVTACMQSAFLLVQSVVCPGSLITTAIYL